MSKYLFSLILVTYSIHLVPQMFVFMSRKVNGCRVFCESDSSQVLNFAHFQCLKPCGMFSRKSTKRCVRYNRYVFAHKRYESYHTVFPSISNRSARLLLSLAGGGGGGEGGGAYSKEAAITCFTFFLKIIIRR